MNGPVSLLDRLSDALQWGDGSVYAGIGKTSHHINVSRAGGVAAGKIASIDPPNNIRRRHGTPP